jgi:hypothetical protein
MKLLPDDRHMGWTPYVWLVYVVAFVAEAAVRPLPFGLRAAALLGVLLFLALYFRAWWHHGRSLLPYIAGMLALGVCFIPSLSPPTSSSSTPRRSPARWARRGWRSATCWRSWRSRSAKRI